MTALQLLGETVRVRRKQLGLTQHQLAERSGLHRSYVGFIERGECNVSFKNLLRLAAALQIRPSTLVHPLDSRPDLYGVHDKEAL